MISAAQLERLCPTARPDLVAAVIVNWHLAEAAGINTPLRVQMFIATIATETGGLRSIDENLHYTTAARLMAVWPSRFKSEAAAKPYLRNPEKLAEKVYGGRLGNTEPGDGYRFRGGGFIQCTGRATYRAVGHENDPDTLRQPAPGFRAAVDWWKRSGCNGVADKNDPGAMRRKVNGGLNGMAEFEAYLTKARKIFVDIPVQPIPPPRPQPDQPAPEPPTTKHDVGRTGGIAAVIIALVIVAGAFLSRCNGG